MKVILELENEKELQKFKEFLSDNEITSFKVKKNKKKILNDILNKYQVKLPEDYKFDREEIHER